MSVASSMASLARSEAQSNTRKLILSCRSREFVDFTHHSTRVLASTSRSQSSQRDLAGWQPEPVTGFLIESGCLRRKVSEHMPPRFLIHLCLEGVQLFKRNRGLGRRSGADLLNKPVQFDTRLAWGLLFDS